MLQYVVIIILCRMQHIAGKKKEDKGDGAVPPAANATVVAPLTGAPTQPIVAEFVVPAPDGNDGFVALNVTFSSEVHAAGPAEEEHDKDSDEDDDESGDENGNSVEEDLEPGEYQTPLLENDTIIVSLPDDTSVCVDY